MANYIFKSPINRQEIFDKAVEVSKARNWGFAVNSKTKTCMYRSDNGPCLIGASIPDELYESRMEGHSFHELHDLIRVNNGDYKFLENLQKVHDDRAIHYENPVSRLELKEALRAFGKDYNLNTDKID